jgi:hypothetical protein
MVGSIGKKVANQPGSSFGPIKRMKGERKLLVFGINDVATKMQGGCSKGKILSRYLSWDNGKFSYICFQVDLVDHEGFQTITLMISKAFVLHHLDKICIGKYIIIINFNCGSKSKYDHGDNLHVINTCLHQHKIYFFLSTLTHCDYYLILLHFNYI